MRYASVIIGILVILILVGVAVAFMRSSSNTGALSYGANTYGTIASNQAVCPQQVARPLQTVQTIPVYQAAAAACPQNLPVYQASVYQTVPAAYYPTMSAYYPTMAAYYPYYPLGNQAAWYTSPSQGQYYYGGNTRTIIYQNPGYQYDYQYQYQNTQVIPGQTNTYTYPISNGGWYQ